MKKVNKIFLTALGMITLLGMISCNSITEPSDGGEGTYEVSMLTKVQKQLAENVEVDMTEDLAIEEIIDEVIMDLEEFDFLKSESTCPVITIDRPDSTRFPRIITKDFGEGCINEWGVEKSGKIIITLYGPWLKEGTIRIVTFEDYTHRGIAVSGEKEIICRGLNEDSLYVHVIKGELSLVKPDSIIVERKLHKIRTLLVGVGDPDVPKEWLIEGQVHVEKSNGISYDVKTREPLYRIQGCRWYQEGIKVIHFDIEDEEGEDESTGDDENRVGDNDDRPKHKVVVDYGYAESDDACDSFVLRTIDGGEPEVVNLKR